MKSSIIIIILVSLLIILVGIQIFIKQSDTPQKSPNLKEIEAEIENSDMGEFGKSIAKAFVKQTSEDMKKGVYSKKIKQVRNIRIWRLETANWDGDLEEDGIFVNIIVKAHDDSNCFPPKKTQVLIKLYTGKEGPSFEWEPDELICTHETTWSPKTGKTNMWSHVVIPISYENINMSTDGNYENALAYAKLTLKNGDTFEALGKLQSNILPRQILIKRR